MRCPGSRSTTRVFVMLLGLAALVSSCVSVTWNRESRYVPPDLEAFERLEPGEATLTDCLEELGAPLWVWEVSASEFAMAWGWFEDTNLGARGECSLFPRRLGFVSFRPLGRAHARVGALLRSRSELARHAARPTQRSQRRTFAAPAGAGRRSRALSPESAGGDSWLHVAGQHRRSGCPVRHLLSTLGEYSHPTTAVFADPYASFGCDRIHISRSERPD